MGRRLFGRLGQLTTDSSAPWRMKVVVGEILGMKRLKWGREWEDGGKMGVEDGQ